MFGPVLRAEVIRYPCFRRVPLHLMRGAFTLTATLSLVTQLEPLAVAAFVADVSRTLGNIPETSAALLSDVLHNAIRNCSAPPADFLEAFSSARHLLLTERLDPITFFNEIRAALEQGVAPSSVGEHLSAETGG
jgi:hypothetical protein